MSFRSPCLSPTVRPRLPKLRVGFVLTRWLSEWTCQRLFYWSSSTRVRDMSSVLVQFFFLAWGFHCGTDHSVGTLDFAKMCTFKWMGASCASQCPPILAPLFSPTSTSKAILPWVLNIYIFFPFNKSDTVQYTVCAASKAYPGSLLCTCELSEIPTTK